MRWNDIRRLAPWLVLALLVAVLVNPQLGTADSSVGGAFCGDFSDLKQDAGFQIDECCARQAGFQVDECCVDVGSRAIGATICEPEMEESTSTPVPSTSTPVPATATPVVVADDSGADALEEPTPTPTAIAPLVRLSPPPPPLRGPTWMGPIKPIPAAQVTLKVPPLLAIFLAQNPVTVTNADGDVVFKGVVPPNRELQLSVPSFGGAGDYTVVGMLIRGARYTEVVPVSAPVS